MADNKWTCAQCTFVDNPVDDVRCLSCGGRRPAGGSSQAPRGEGKRAIKAPPPPPPVQWRSGGGGTSLGAGGSSSPSGSGSGSDSDSSEGGRAAAALRASEGGGAGEGGGGESTCAAWERRSGSVQAPGQSIC